MRVDISQHVLNTSLGSKLNSLQLLNKTSLRVRFKNIQDLIIRG